MITPGYPPYRVAPWFLLGAVIHLAGLAALFPEADAALYARLGVVPRGWVIASQVATWAGLSAIEIRVDHTQQTGDGYAALPVWMQIRNRWIRLSYSLGIVFFVDVIALRVGLPLGNLDPAAPLLHDGSLALRIPWFAAITAFEALLAFVAVGTLVAVGRRVMRPTRRLPVALAFVLAALVGGAFGLAASAGLHSPW